MMDGVLAGKTGFTNKAGYCYVGAVEQDGKCMIAVVLASGWPPNKTNKWSDIKKLITYGMQNYEYVDITKDVQEEFTVQVNKGEQDSVKGRAELFPIKALMKSDEEIKWTRYVLGTLSAPVAAGTEIGAVRCYLGDTLLQTWEIKTLEDVQVEKTWF
jgi:D-alanyl-D-alanine carboxypeptidase (penicillin-binding protein 5/6)